MPVKRILSPLAMILLSASLHAEPNFVVLLVDDAGFMDFGGYGGEASTPNITRLADQGIRFSNYHTSPLCAPSRAMLLTGRDNHRTGIATIPEVLTEEQKASPAYAQRLQPGVATIAEILRDAGYQTFMTGKWHLGREDGDLPNNHGFDRSFILDASGADNWEQKSYMPYYGIAPWYEDGEPANLPEDFYSSRFLVDKMQEYLDSRNTEKPFFAYIAFQAIHIPVQAPREFTEKYEGTYRDGWDATLARRFQRAIQLGLIPFNASPPTLHPALGSWDTLSEEEKAHYESSMMVNAGMLEAMDHYIGQFLDYLEESGELENTIFVVTSDNGPEFNEPATSALMRLWMSQNGYHTDVDRRGEKGYLGAIGPGWASAAAAPGSLFKMYASEGGTRAPLIISGPGIPHTQGFNSNLNFVTDIAPTIADLAGLPSDPDMDGRSLMPLINGERATLYDDDEAIGLEVAGNSALFKGHYKLTKNSLPHGDATWRLYDLASDPAESRDLSDQLPEFREELLSDYSAYAAAVGVIALPPDFDISKQVAANTANKFLSRNAAKIGTAVAVLVFLLAVTGYLVYRLFRRKQAH